ncbi:DUF423 domain-containing protein [Adhaeretor mobilis]|uniref:DUF423 domain-containing protein n=1 Tax=Adhaeretor mobilis TaxID=1930276 RepID=A0A517MSZ7_9BACT|nr:DUF423 domain-containing protein [Adhaeretor mobilis]QDS97999.1 hypothetical protein HG15A2_12690 [Adhaeretor mobilis]
MSPRMILLAGSLVMLTGVAIGAFGAHGLEKMLERLGRTTSLAQRAEWLETGVRYQLVHGLGLLALASFAMREPSRLLSAASVALLLGVLLFSGSLYAMTLGPATWKKLGMVVPVGGLAYLVGWGLLAVESWKRV